MTSGWPPHITVATIVQRNGLYLMVEEIESGRRVINQPAGHLEPGESLFEAARRETLEETGWVVELQRFIGIYQYLSPANGVLYFRFAFTAGPVEQREIAIDPDIVAVHWLSEEEISALSHRSPMVSQCITDAENGPGYPLSIVQHLV